MNVFDENMRADQLALLRQKRIPVKKIGEDLGHTAMTDEDIIPLLHELDRPTFFTLDADFYKPRLRHKGYCLVFLDIDDALAADFVRRILRHPALSTKAKPMGTVIRAEPDGMSLWRVRREGEEHLSWEQRT